MAQSPSPEGKSPEDSQEFPCVLCNPSVRDRVSKASSGCIQSLVNPVHDLYPSSVKSISVPRIIFASAPTSPAYFFPSGFTTTKTLRAFFFRPYEHYMPLPHNSP